MTEEQAKVSQRSQKAITTKGKKNAKLDEQESHRLVETLQNTSATKDQYVNKFQTSAVKNFERTLHKGKYGQKAYK